MPFLLHGGDDHGVSARDTNVLNGISAGDEINFTLVVTETNDWIENVRAIGKTNVFGYVAGSARLACRGAGS